MPCLSVRAATVADAFAINRIYNHYVRNTAITFDLEPWSIKQREDWIAEFAESASGKSANDQSVSGKNPYHAVVAELDGEITGFAYNSQFRPRAAYRLSTETTIYTDPTLSPTSQKPPAAMHGCGTLLYTTLFNRIKNTNLHRGYAIIALPNPRSIAFHQKFGFTPIGTLHQVGYKFGRHWDATWFEKALK